MARIVWLGLCKAKIDHFPGVFLFAIVFWRNVLSAGADNKSFSEGYSPLSLLNSIETGMIMTMMTRGERREDCLD